MGQVTRILGESLFKQHSHQATVQSRSDDGDSKQLAERKVHMRWHLMKGGQLWASFLINYFQGMSGLRASMNSTSGSWDPRALGN